MPHHVHRYSLFFQGDAFDLFHTFKDQPNPFFLDSSLQGRGARFSYIGFAPFKIVKDTDLAGLKKAFTKYRLKRQSLPFPAGAVGYWGYDGSLCFGFYDTILRLDHQTKKLVISSFHPSRIKDIVRLLRKTEVSPMKGLLSRRQVVLKSNFTKAQYLNAVRKALEHIRRGDIYQINLSHQLKAHMHGWRQDIHPAAIYQQLRTAFPSEFGAYFDDGQQVILSASPERFLKLDKGIAQVKPMKGTRPRGKTKAQDKALRQELLKSPKEMAELLMVTDLERNDLGKVCDYKTVKVTAMREIEEYHSVFQATSTIEGRLRRDCNQFDLLQATFPSGSVTGCPKLAAMKIIKKLEHGPRGLYTGALGYISFSGDMDFNVMIRTMFLKKDSISFHVGGGIVADSKPQEEWQETWDKAKPLIETLTKAFA